MHNYVRKEIRVYVILIGIGIIYSIWYRFTQIGIPCIFYLVTGLYCPGCGVSRMLLSLMQFKWMKAFYYNRLLFLLLPFGIFVAGRHIGYLIWKGERYPYKRYHSWITYVLIILLLLFGILRNLPEFSYLRP